ncbi:Bacterial extracellular solute-binding protein [compost metagenome]
MNQDKYDLTTYSEGVLDSLKEMGQGKLYGLSPYIRMQAIVYNADLFKKHGVDLPRDGMTWQEILDTARRFPTDGSDNERIYGFGLRDGLTLSALANGIAVTEGLAAYNGNTGQVTMNTDSWKETYKLALDAISSKSVHEKTEGGHANGPMSMEDYIATQPFLMGRTAMTMANISLVDDINNLEDLGLDLKGAKSFEVGLVAGPVSHAEPNKTSSSYIDQIFSLYTGSLNKEVAWDFIKYANSEELAKVKSKMIAQGISSRVGVSKEYNGYSLESLHKLGPKLLPDYGVDKIPEGFLQQHSEILSRESELIKNNKKSIEEALKTIQNESQVTLDQLSKN